MEAKSKFHVGDRVRIARPILRENLPLVGTMGEFIGHVHIYDAAIVRLDGQTQTIRLPLEALEPVVSVTDLGDPSQKWIDVHFPKNTLIISSTGQHPDATLKVVGWVGDVLKAFPPGGGREYVFDRAAREKFGFRELREDEKVPQWVPGFFEFDGAPDDERYPGWWDGSRWNGWARPRFTEETLMKIFASFLTGDAPESDFVWVDRRDTTGMIAYAFEQKEHPEPEEDWGNTMPEWIEGVNEPVFELSGFCFVQCNDDKEV